LRRMDRLGKQGQVIPDYGFSSWLGHIKMEVSDKTFSSKEVSDNIFRINFFCHQSVEMVKSSNSAYFATLKILGNLSDL
jgi:hypothetical protein